VTIAANEVTLRPQVAPWNREVPERPGHHGLVEAHRGFERRNRAHGVPRRRRHHRLHSPSAGKHPDRQRRGRWAAASSAAAMQAYQSPTARSTATTSLSKPETTRIPERWKEISSSCSARWNGLPNIPARGAHRTTPRSWPAARRIGSIEKSKHALPHQHSGGIASRRAIIASGSGARAGSEILLVGGNPVRRDVALRRGQIDFAGAHHFVKALFQFILHVCIPCPRCGRLRP
jgi:hypothetical protein